MQNIILYSKDRKNKEILQLFGLLNIWVNKHNIPYYTYRVFESYYVTELMINTSKLGTLVYRHTLDAHIMYYLKITGNWSHIYINYLPTIEYTYLNLDVKPTIY